MDDIFQKAVAGNKSSIKGLYTCSVESAFAAVNAALEDEQKSVEIVQQIYVSALSSAKSYEDFFRLLNKRALSACKLDKAQNLTLEPIEATQSVFADLKTLAIPEALQSYDEALGEVVAGRIAEKHKFRLPKLKKRVKSEKGELQEFAELVKKHEFATLDNYKPPKEEKLEKPQTIAQKLEPEEPIASDEQLILQSIEKRKSKRASIIAFAFATVIFAGAITTYFLTSKTLLHKTVSIPSTTAVTKQQTEPTAVYNEEDAKKAYTDYLKQLQQKQHVVTNERIVMYNETNDIGSEQLNGLACAKYIDFERDGKKELATITLSIRHEGLRYYYSYLLSIYAFSNLQVEPLVENYTLLEYTVYNSYDPETKANVNMFVRLIKGKDMPYLYAEAYSKDYRISSFHYFESGKMRLAERFVFYRWDKNAQIYLQSYVDGTYAPLYATNNTIVLTDGGSISSRNLNELKRHDITLSSYEVKFTSKKALTQYYNDAMKRLNLSAKKASFSLQSDDKTDYLCAFKTQTLAGDTLSYKLVGQLKDYTKLLKQ